MTLSSHVHIRWNNERGILVKHSSAHGREDVPESESLISSTSDDVLTTWTDREIQNTTRVTCQCLYFLHAWVLPKDYLIEGVAMSAHNFVCCLREHKVTHLGASVDWVKRLESVCVPETDVTVSCSSTSGQETVLMRWPAYGLNSSCVLMELDDRFVRT